MGNINYCLFLCSISFLFKSFTSHSIIFENNLYTCSFNSSFSNGSESTFTSEIWEVEDSEMVLYYTLCGSLPEKINCGLNVAACFKNKKNNSSHMAGKQFVLESNNGSTSKLSLKTVRGDKCNINSGEKYKFTIIFDCDQQMKETRLEKKSECDYIIYMIHPQCSLDCTTTFQNRLIDMRHLKGNYFVESEGSNFSLALCGAKQQNCFKDNSQISICVKYNGGMIALSQTKKERIVYNPEKNEIMYRGSYKGVNGTKKFELLLKCDWGNNLLQIKRKKVPIQGKEYKFVMDSSYGCVKLPPKCVIKEASLVYNLTNLFKTYGYEVSNVSNGRIYLNVCGSLRFKEKLENSCSRSYSQVCELKDGKYINRGSILSYFEVVNDVIKVTYSNGMKCEEDPLKQYSTHIDFFCSKTDQGPEFIRTNICDLYIVWYTPEACPIYNKSVCHYKRQVHQDCSVTFQGQTYELSPLKRHEGYEILDPKNNSIQYFLNVCDPVIDSDPPCMKTSMIVMKDMNEVNIKYRTKSLGKMDSISVINNQIVITTLSGTYCGSEGDYTSNLYLICIHENEKESLQLVKNTECTFHFQWKTPYGCLRNHSNTNQCLIEDASSGISLDFAQLRQTSLRIVINDISYLFDFCKQSYTECLSNDHCDDVPLTKQLLLSSNGTAILELSLPKDCDMSGAINKVIFELMCDRITYNEHYKLEDKVDNCTVNLVLFTNLVCSKEEYQINNINENDKYDVSGSGISKEEKEHCLVSNYINGFKINISSLHLDIPIDVCPLVIFYESNTSVILMYATERICSESSANAKYEYKAILHCSNQESRKVTKTACYELYYLEDPEFCNLFQSSSLDVPKRSNAVIITCSTIAAVLFLGICVFFIYKWRIHLRRLSYLTVYEKDADI